MPINSGRQSAARLRVVPHHSFGTQPVSCPGAPTPSAGQGDRVQQLAGGGADLSSELALS